MTGISEKHKAIAIIVVAVIAIVVAGFVFVNNQNAEPVEPSIPVIDATDMDPDAITPEDDGFGSDDDSHEDTLDFSAQTKAGTSALTAFLTYDTSETPAARLARLGEDFADPDRVADMTPKVLNDGHEGFANYSAKLTVDSIDAVAWLEQATPTSDTFIVFVSYTLTETITGQDRVTRDRGEWRVTFERDAPGVVTLFRQ